ncbi:MAG TPA: TadE family protein [Candidatus Limnocylindrales bacterium]|nr:TadE family protein [Candidatus Limnocylindrales bacterium]
MSGLRSTQRPGGQALVEFALVFPLILLLIFGAVDFGRAIFAYNTLSEAARQANRLAIVDQTVTDVQARATQAAPGVTFNLPNDVQVCFKAADSADKDCDPPNSDACSNLEIGCLAFVTAKTQFRPLTPVISTLVGTLDLSSTSVGPIEYVCPTAAHPNCP